ncbi:hypothetical protein SARC_08271 [Sphaeroforma arctica JP610]|uniref:Uncharacterized protein n=1 Tax=Sphaeroforma arctica JP610 TaxID=667725 RepID=A0A0L0FRD4_9EUKA|nr:hypothetical protein SARC_08271 [Sphaeroforma arctica JP610]KNC79335.1 hypothetical protein SARC_08271 [Sphaeroforma arctica JP610]|eukprot:XP_014153237.1 hypothetical protein SARC_08271 [Sphaeroforma arctica JP610]
MQQKSEKEIEDYRYFDPKLLRQGDIVKTRTIFSEAIVFMVGGGNYVEFHNLKEYQKRSQTPSHITYGATTLFSAEDFLVELNALGRGGQALA